MTICEDYLVIVSPFDLGFLRSGLFEADCILLLLESNDEGGHRSTTSCLFCLVQLPIGHCHKLDGVRCPSHVHNHLVGDGLEHRIDFGLGFWDLILVLEPANDDDVFQVFVDGFVGPFFQLCDGCVELVDPLLLIVNFLA